MYLSKVRLPHLGHEGVEHVIPAGRSDQPGIFVLHAIALVFNQLTTIMIQQQREIDESPEEMSLYSIYQDHPDHCLIFTAPEKDLH